VQTELLVRLKTFKITSKTICGNRKKENVKIYGAVNSKYIQSAMLYHLKPILEKWSNTKLVNKIGAYGIRRYLRDSTLIFHVDRLPTHIISAILQLDQKVEQDWPIVVSINGKHTNITLKPGEMLLYESARIPHGRPYPLNGHK